MPAPIQKAIGKPDSFQLIASEVRDSQAAVRAHPREPLHQFRGTTLVPQYVLSDGEGGKQVDSVKTCSNINPPEAQKQHCKYSQVNTWHKGRAIKFTNFGGNFLPNGFVSTIKSVTVDLLPLAFLQKQ